MSSIKSKDISRTFKDHTVGLGIILKDRQNTTKPQDCSVHTTATFSLCFMLAASGPLWEESALSLGFRIISQNWIAAYLGYTLRLFHVWPVMVHDTHTRRRKKSFWWQMFCCSWTTYPEQLTCQSVRQGSQLHRIQKKTGVKAFMFQTDCSASWLFWLLCLIKNVTYLLTKQVHETNKPTQC